MNEGSTHRPYSLRVLSNLLISACRFNVHCFVPDNGMFTLNPKSPQIQNQTEVKHLFKWASEFATFTANIIKPVNDDENAWEIHQQFNFETVLK